MKTSLVIVVGLIFCGGVYSDELGEQITPIEKSFIVAQKGQLPLFYGHIVLGHLGKCSVEWQINELVPGLEDQARTNKEAASNKLKYDFTDETKGSYLFARGMGMTINTGMWPQENCEPFREYRISYKIHKCSESEEEQQEQVLIADLSVKCSYSYDEKGNYNCDFSLCGKYLKDWKLDSTLHSADKDSVGKPIPPFYEIVITSRAPEKKEENSQVGDASRVLQIKQ